MIIKIIFHKKLCFLKIDRKTCIFYSNLHTHYPQSLGQIIEFRHMVSACMDERHDDIDKRFFIFKSILGTVLVWIMINDRLTNVNQTYTHTNILIHPCKQTLLLA